MLNGIDWYPEPQDNLEMIRLRRLKLLPPDKTGSELVINTPSHVRVGNAKSICHEWFRDMNPIKHGFDVVGATISFHFHASINRKTGRTLHCDLSCPSSSNLKNFSEKDRALIERYIDKWGLQEEAA